ncbi:MAG: autotransporter domain-containing protein [Pseudomonadaceae bacterium]
MNRVYRLVWSAGRQAWVAASELARGRSKGSAGKSRGALLKASALLVVGMPGAAFGVTLNWDGGDPDDTNWSSEANWNPDAFPTTGSTEENPNVLVFGGTGTTTYNDVGGRFIIEFSAGATAFNLAGSNSIISHGITNNSSTLQTISMGSIEVPYNTATWDAGEGGLHFAGGVNMGGVLTVTGSGNTSIMGNVASAGFTSTVIKEGAGTLTLLGGVFNTRLRMKEGVLQVFGSLSGTGELEFDGGTLLASSGITSGKAVTFSAAGGTIDTAGNLVTLSGSLSGAGGFTKAGAGTLVLTGNGSYTGPVTISAGTLQGDSDSLVTNIINNSSLVFDQAADGTYARNISGTGSLTKIGAGVLTLSGSNTYSGGTTVSAGGLVGNSSSLQGAIVNNASVTFDQAALGTYAGQMSGSGSLTKSGLGTLVLSGTNSYSGGTTITDGTLQGTTNSLQGSVVNNGTLAFAQAFNGTFTGGISGSGQLLKSGSGTLVLGGTNSYSGGTVVSGGVLESSTGSLSGNITNNAQVTFNQAADGTYAGVLSGTGQLVKTGTGVLTLSGLNTYSGGTVVSAGALQGDTSTLLGDITNNAEVIFAQAMDGLYAGTMTGTGLLTKTGAGALVLTGDHSQAQGIEVEAGLLQVGNGGTAGSVSGPISLASGATLGFNRTDSVSHTGVISGAGGVVQGGSGDLRLAAANTYQGGTVLEAGSLTVANNQALGSGDVVFDGGALGLEGPRILTNDFSLLTDATFNQAALGHAVLLGAIGLNTGTKVITSNGAGSLLDLGGAISGDTADTGLQLATDEAGADMTVIRMRGSEANSYTGDTQVGAQVSLQLMKDANVTAVQGDLRIDADAIVSVANTEQIADSSWVYMADGSRLNLGGMGSVTETIHGLSGDGALDLFGNSLLQLSEGSFAGPISGSGGLVKNGAQTLVLSGVSSYTGETVVNGGTLYANGVLASAMRVNSGGRLGGSGTVGSITLGSGAVLAPGNSIGTLNVAGDVDFTGGGVYQVEVDAAGNSDQLIASGTAYLSGGSVEVLPADGEYSVSTDYLILSAGAIDGTFDTVSSSLAFLTPSLRYDSENVYLRLLRNDVDFAGVAATQNQRAVASTLLGALSAGPSADLTTLMDTLLFLTEAGARQGYDALSGVQHTNSQAVLLGSGRRLNSMLHHRSRQLGLAPGMAAASLSAVEPVAVSVDGNAGDQLRGMSAGDTGGTAAQGSGLWLNVQGGNGKLDDDRNATGASYDWQGLYLGADAWLSEQLLVGAAIGLAETDMDPAYGSSEMDSVQLAAYGRWQDGLRYVDAAVDVGSHSVDAERDVRLGNLSRTATSDYDAKTRGVSLEAGQGIDLSDATRITPFLGMSYAHLDREGFAEKGAGDANLRVDGETEESLQGRIGVRLEQALVDDSRRSVDLDLSLGWGYEFADQSSALRTSLSGAPALPFTVEGPERDRGQLELGAGVSASLSERVQLRVGYQGQLSGNYQDHSANSILSIRW